MKTNAWFLLYGGTSVDGRGPGHFLKRTECPSESRTHYEKCRENPYSVGRVDIVTDDCIERAGMLTDWSAYSIADKEPIAFAERPPLKSDLDYKGKLQAWSGRCWDLWDWPTILHWEEWGLTHWMPTGLVRPAPPVSGGE